MLVANQAFIELVTAGVINAGSLITVGEVNDKIAAEDLLAQGYASDAQSAASNYASGLLTDYINATGITRDYTVIQNGKIVTGLIDVQTLLAQNITLAATGYIKSANYNEQSGTPRNGFMLDAANDLIKGCGAHFTDAKIDGWIEAIGGRFKAGLGDVQVQDFFPMPYYNEATQKYVDLTELITVSGFLLIYEGKRFSVVGTEPFTSIVRYYDHCALYFYAYDTTGQQFMPVEQDRSNLRLHKIYGDDLLLVVPDPDNFSQNVIRITNRAGGEYQKFYKLINLKKILICNAD